MSLVLHIGTMVLSGFCLGIGFACSRGFLEAVKRAAAAVKVKLDLLLGKLAEQYMRLSSGMSKAEWAQFSASLV